MQRTATPSEVSNLWNTVHTSFTKRAFFEGLVSDSFSIDDFLDLIGLFGKPLRTKHFSIANGLIQRVANDGLFDNQKVPWHNDYSYSTGEFLGTALLCESDEASCPTTFADMSSLIPLLSQDEVQQLKSTVCSFAPPNDLKNCFTKMQWRRIEQEGVKRGLIQTDYITKSECVYCSPATLVGDFKKTPLFDKIMNLAESHSFDVRWVPRKLVIYDNYRYMHKRDSFVGARSILRIQFNYENLNKGI